ncbi:MULTISPECIES: TIGR03643 family protein [unclassified Polynucleobacter]|jgi:uncharacterized protein (TIGR03643 family)|uniref:TIGR03643 family protein n=1 Tax=unclassified Polynucleobacter TaxID=2640945 RepID=UPI001BFE2EC9|nr:MULTISPECIES: TIGR03643 family protein [unclassified Polynucleobacter]QWE22209.1 TIGR03643 family protein [Polynucleobacter sp. AP-Jannik-300A-C4]QWE28315.1 TIGR03643 family protein [Polynucleobacter sp. AM-7D1]
MTTRLPQTLSEADLSRLIEMAWEDRTPFDAIKSTFGYSEPQVIALMRKQLKRNSFELWRKRVTGRATKHVALRSKLVNRAYCATQYKQKSAS